MNDNSYDSWYAVSDEGIAQIIGKFVKHHRMRQNKTQEKLAEEAGISRSTLSLLEKGDSITLTTLIRVLRLLDQLSVFKDFILTQQPSPLLLAKAEKEKRQRATAMRRKEKRKDEDTDKDKEIDW